MPKRKKKPGRISFKKTSKAQHRKAFLDRLKYFCDNICQDNIFRLIPEKELEYLYTYRLQPVRVDKGPGQQVPAAMLNEAKLLVSHWIKTQPVDFVIGNIKTIMLHDFTTVVFTLMSYASGLDELKYAGAATVKKALLPLVELEKSPTYDKAWKSFFDALFVLSMQSNSLSSNMYAFKFETKTILNDKNIPALFFGVEIHVMRTPVLDLTIEHSTRAFSRVSWAVAEPVPHLDFATVDSHTLGHKAGRSLSVYIQAHALKRLIERMDGIPEGILHYHMYHSFNHTRAIKLKGNNFLFEFRIFEQKAGYFVGTVLGNMILVRTFLFLTNNGTPEATKLQASTGLQKQDTIYLNINKFSTFATSDIVTNDEVKQIFIDAGCGSLFNIPSCVYYASKEKIQPVASLIQKYLYGRT